MSKRLAVLTKHFIIFPSISPCVTSGYENIQTEKIGRVGIIKLNRTKAFNAINKALMEELTHAISLFEADEEIGCLVLTGNGKAFAAGADIKEMLTKTFSSMYSKDFLLPWEKIAQCKLPIIAAVNGVALGGGCEIAMMCDIILCSENAKFGQPEITIGTIAGAGGSQRLTRAVGKSKAMEMLLTGNAISAEEALQFGLVSRIIKSETLLSEAIAMAKRISEFSRPVIIAAKQSANFAFESTLQTGLQVERKMFHSTFALKDRKEGMEAFSNKKKPNFTHV